jgi:tetratricopeptide (TPR) repeat protein
LDQGDLPGAGTAFASLYAQYPAVEEVAVGHAYMQLLQGQHAGADETLAALETVPDVDVGAVKLRRALVAADRGSDGIDAAKTFGAASGRDEGLLIAAEGHLVDGEEEEAYAILRDLSKKSGPTGEAAAKYMECIDSDAKQLYDYAEIAAYWSFKMYDDAVGTAEELFEKFGPEEYEGYDEAALLWASRAASIGQADNASGLLDYIETIPPGQGWRVNATRAHIAVIEGDVDTAVDIFDKLEAAGAPWDGLTDARAVACSLAMDSSRTNPDREQAKRLIGDAESAAAARCLMEARAPQAAMTAAPEGPLRNYLENR